MVTVQIDSEPLSLAPSQPTPSLGYPDRSISTSLGTKGSPRGGTTMSGIPQFHTPSTGMKSFGSNNTAHTFKTVSDYATTIATIMSQRTLVNHKGRLQTYPKLE